MKYRRLLAWCWLLLLVGCGAERDEPFDPGVSDDDDDSVESISIRKVVSGEQPLLAIDGQKQLLVLRDEDDYFLFLDRYTDQLLAYEPDFSEGQVVLIDLGEREDNQCTYQLELITVSAQTIDEDTAELNVKYGANTLDTSDACPEEDPDTIRPFYFYYVDTRSQLLIVELFDD